MFPTCSSGISLDRYSAQTKRKFMETFAKRNLEDADRIRQHAVKHGLDVVSMVEKVSHDMKEAYGPNISNLYGCDTIRDNIFTIARMKVSNALTLSKSELTSSFNRDLHILLGEVENNVVRSD